MIKSMRLVKFHILFFVILLTLACGSGGGDDPSPSVPCTGSSPNWTCPPDRNSIHSLINLGSPAGFTANDTITMSSGTATWSSTLTFTKGVTFVGAGTEASNAITNLTLAYTPTSPSTDMLKITNMNLVNPHIAMRNYRSTTFSTFIFGNSVVAATRVPIEIVGQFKGVVYSNTMTGTPHIDNLGSNGWGWANLSPSGNTFEHGTENCIYYEDNTFTTNETAFTGGHAGRYCARYNTYIWTMSGQGYHPWFDCHGNQPTVYGAMGVEIYGNLVDLNGHGGTMADLRGGHSVVFYNAAIDAGSAMATKFREEYTDADYPEANSYLMHITETRVWNNRTASNTSLAGSLMLGYVSNGPEYSGPISVLNSDVWFDARARFDRPYGTQEQAAGGTFDGTFGVGCGTLASRPATCAQGVGYWVPASGQESSCTDLSGYVGASHTSNINGTLYICGSNNWTDATTYTPYTYPHPLR